MLNFFKRQLVKLLTRKTLLVSNRTTQEYFILSHVSSDGYVVLLTSFKTYLPISYKIYKRMFQPEQRVPVEIAIGNVLSIEDDRIFLSSGESVRLSEVNETDFEESMDTSF
jgi:hypothetical protein